MRSVPDDLKCVARAAPWIPGASASIAIHSGAGGPHSTSLPRPSLAIAVILLCLLPACGRRTLPKAPELVRPATIEDLAVTQTETGVELSWGRPDKYADGSRMSDLGTFTIERAEADGDFQTLATVAVTDRDRFRKIRRLRYADRTAVSGRYRYRVLSSTLDDYVSAPSNEVEIALP